MASTQGVYNPVDKSSNVQGSMNVQGISRDEQTGRQTFNTLDEPIRTTIMRDLSAVGLKFKHVLQPKFKQERQTQERNSLLKDWDLWGPLLLCTFMAIILQGTPDDINDGGPQFAQVFVIVWIGAIVVTLNSKLLGGNISFFQSVCVIGYCLLPLAVSLVFCRLILFLHQTDLLFFLRFLITMSGFGWAAFASVSFLGDDSQPPGRKGLVVYPIFLFYFVIAWLILSHTVE